MLAVFLLWAAKTIALRSKRHTFLADSLNARSQFVHELLIHLKQFGVSLNSYCALNFCKSKFLVGG